MKAIHFAGFLAVVSSLKETRFQNEQDYLKQFNNNQVWRIKTTTKSQMQDLFEMVEASPSLYDIWTQQPTHTDIYVQSALFPVLSAWLKSRNLTHRVMIEDVQELIAQQAQEKANKVEKSFHKSYHDLQDIYGFMEGLAKKYAEASVFSIGQSYESREIKGIEIKFGENLPEIIFNGGMHSREWIGTATCLYIMERLLKDKPTTGFNWLIVPVLNVDGYAYTHSTNRMWRKNRQPNKFAWQVFFDSGVPALTPTATGTFSLERVAQAAIHAAKPTTDRTPSRPQSLPLWPASSLVD